VIPLTRLPRGARATVAALPQPHGLARRLCSLGLTPGAELRVLQNRGSGPVIVEVHGARLALGRAQADRLTVDLLEHGEQAGETTANAAADR
jgi:Fe2+ transport system protein FeoA